MKLYPLNLIFILNFVHSHNGQTEGERSIPASETTIDCYRCKSANFADRSCHDPFSKTTSALIERCKINMGTSEILVPANHCIKIVGTFIKTGEEVVVRDCTVDRIDHHCLYEEVDGERIKKCTWTCNVNGCNHAYGMMKLGTKLEIKLIIFITIIAQIILF